MAMASHYNTGESHKSRRALEEKEQRRIKRRQEEAETWAQARIQNLTRDSPPTDRTGAVYLEEHYPDLLRKLDDDSDQDSERRQEYTIREARRGPKNRAIPTASTSFAPTSAEAELQASGIPEAVTKSQGEQIADAAVGKKDASIDIKNHEHQENVAASEDSSSTNQSAVATFDNKPRETQTTSIPQLSLHHEFPPAYSQFLEQDNKPTERQDQQNNTQLNPSGSGTLTLVDTINTSRGDASDSIPPRALSSSASSMVVRPSLRVPATRLEDILQAAQRRRDQAILLMAAYVHQMNTLDPNIQISRSDCVRLLADTNTLLQAFSLVFGPQRYPSAATDEGIVYRIIPPPGIDGPRRISMFFTKIWASRLILASDQPNGTIQPGLTASQGVMYFDGSFQTAAGRNCGRETLPPTPRLLPQPIPKNLNDVIALDEPSCSTATQHIAKVSENQRRLKSSRFWLITSNSTAAPPVHLASTSDRRKYMSSPEKPEMQRVRSTLALEVARRELGLTPKQILFFMAVPIQTGNERTHTEEQREDVKTLIKETTTPPKQSKFFPSHSPTLEIERSYENDALKQNPPRLTAAASATKSKRLAETRAVPPKFENGEIIPVVSQDLHLDEERYDLDDLLRKASIPYVRPQQVQQREGDKAKPRESSQNHPIAALDTQDINARKDSFTTASASSANRARTPLHRRTPAQSNISRFSGAAAPFTSTYKKGDVLSLPLKPRDHGTPTAAPRSFRPTSGGIKPSVAPDTVHRLVPPTAPLSMRGEGQTRATASQQKQAARPAHRQRYSRLSQPSQIISTFNMPPHQYRNQSQDLPHSQTQLPSQFHPHQSFLPSQQYQNQHKPHNNLPPYHHHHHHHHTSNALSAPPQQEVYGNFYEPMQLWSMPQANNQYQHSTNYNLEPMLSGAGFGGTPFNHFSQNYTPSPQPQQFLVLHHHHHHHQTQQQQAYQKHQPYQPYSGSFSLPFPNSQGSTLVSNTTVLHPLSNQALPGLANRVNNDGIASVTPAYHRQRILTERAEKQKEMEKQQE